MDDLVKRLRSLYFADEALLEEAADRIEELEAKLLSATMDGYDMAKYEYRDRIEELEAKLAKAVEVLERVMVGGNHLAILLPDNFPPAETEPLTALNIMGAGEGYEVWCCWRCIMLARATLAELKGGKDE